jgi:hypothetical protein
MIVPHRSRCIIASRYFRKLRLSSDEVSVLEILPLSDRKVHALFAKSASLSQSQIDDFFSNLHLMDFDCEKPFYRESSY